MTMMENKDLEFVKKLKEKTDELLNLTEEYLNEQNPSLRRNLPELDDLKQEDHRAKDVYQRDQSSPTRLIIQKIYQELKRIKKVIKLQFDFKRKSILLKLKDELFGKSSIRKKDGSTMTFPETITESITIMPARKHKLKYKPKEKLIPVDYEDIEITVDNNEEVSKLMSSANSRTIMTFSGQRDSFLCSLAEEGITVKKEGKELYSGNPGYPNDWLMDIVYINGAYYAFNWSGKNILKKMEDSSEPVVWWEERPIVSFGNFNKQIRASFDKKSLILNENETDITVIEIEEDGDPGREMVIKNTSGSRVNCHLPLPNNRLLTITQNGLITIYEMNLQNYSLYVENDKLQLTLTEDRREDEFFVSLCEKSKFLAIFVRRFGGVGKASLIMIYSLLDSRGRNELKFLTQLDLYSQGLNGYWCFCFSKYFGDKLFLCGYSSLYENATHVYGYDITKNEISWRESLLVGEDCMKSCYKLSRVGNEVLGVVGGGKILQFRFRMKG